MQQQKPDPSDSMVIMGRIVAAQGLLGWVKVQTFTEHLDTLIDYDTWQLGNDTHPWREFKVLECKPHTKVLVAKLEGITDRTAAEKCKGLLIAVPRSSLPKAAEDEYYWSDLIGLNVVNLQGESLGKVDNLLDMGANDVMCVRNDKGEILIPFLSHVVQQVSLDEKLIRVDWQADY
ncbi:MAG TPA: ribosome maturation factor RimM [Gallionellaceae bacterium]|nr:ribosome maturation factor RimM [Gallionellaceae bacterium]